MLSIIVQICCLLLFGALRLQEEHEAEMVESGAHCVLILLFCNNTNFLTEMGVTIETQEALILAEKSYQIESSI